MLTAALPSMFIGCQPYRRELGAVVKGGADGGEQRRDAGDPPGWYVDSAYGSDDNDGRSSAGPLSTIAALLSRGVSGADTVYLARGSCWREQLIGLPAGVTVSSYGSGPRPIIDGSDPVPNASFTKTPGYANVYQISVVHNFGAASLAGQNVAHRLWENGVMLRRCVSAVPNPTLNDQLTALDAMAGAFYADQPTLGPDAVYVHAAGNTNPATNGRVYEAATREWAVRLNDYVNGARILGVHTRRNAHADGSLKFDGYASNCLAEDGRKHCIFALGVAEDCIAQGIEAPSVIGGASMFVSYEDRFDVPSVVYRRCQAIANNDILGPLGGTNKDFTLGFFGHTANARRFVSATFEDCHVSGCYEAYQFQQIDSVGYVNCDSEGAHTVYRPYATNVAITGGSHVAGTGTNVACISYDNDFELPASITMRGVGWYGGGASNAFPVWINVGNVVHCAVDIQYCTFVGPSQSSVRLQKTSFIFKHNIVCGFELNAYTSTYDGDYNLWCNLTGFADAKVHFFYNALESIGALAWQSAHPAFDQHSIEADPMFMGELLTGDFSIASNSPAVALQAGVTFYEAA